MKKLFYFAWVLMALFVHSNSAAQVSTNYKLGTIESITSEFSIKKRGQTFLLKLSPTESISIKTTAVNKDKGQLKFFGSIVGAESSVFYLILDSENVTGEILNNDKGTIRKITTNTAKEVVITKSQKNPGICPPQSKRNNKVTTSNSETQRIANKQAAYPIFSSNPGATVVVYLDFDGEEVSDPYWETQIQGYPTSLPTNYSEAFIKKIWAIVAEDYRPFKVNVTTDKAAFDAAQAGQRVQCIFSPNFSIDTYGGFSNRQIMTVTPPTQKCFVFTDYLYNNESDLGNTASHEVGHAFSLEHDGDGNLGTTYWKGHGDYCAIMGSDFESKDVPVYQWSKGEYQYAVNNELEPNVQDDINLIATRNGSGFRTDDHGGTRATATQLIFETDGTILGTKNNGIIEQRTDKDFFVFTHTGGNFSVNVLSGTGTSLNEGNLDIQLRLLDSNGAQKAISNPLGLNAGINVVNLNAGTYYLEIDGVGHGDPLTNGYSDYGSLGYYEINNAPTVADFLWNYNACGEYRFRDLSTNAPTSWSWNFGDGTFSTEKNPIHTYSSDGQYTVRLDATNSKNTYYQYYSNIVALKQYKTLPVTENFENTFPAAEWYVSTLNGEKTWEQSKNVGYKSSSSMIMKNNSQGDSQGELQLPAFNFTNAKNIKLSFYVAYAKEVDKYNTLRVFVNKNCEKTDDKIYEKFAADLQSVTISDPILAANFTPTKDSDWKLVTIDLNNYIGSSNVTIKLRNYSEGDSPIWIDNISIIDSQITLGTNDFTTDSSFQVYPNPTKGKVTVKLDKIHQNVEATVTTLVGQKISNKVYKDTDQIEVNIEGTNGLYLLQLKIDGKTEVVKVLKQ